MVCYHLANSAIPPQPPYGSSYVLNLGGEPCQNAGKGIAFWLDGRKARKDTIIQASPVALQCGELIGFYVYIECRMI